MEKHVVHMLSLKNDRSCVRVRVSSVVCPQYFLKLMHGYH